MAQSSKTMNPDQTLQEQKTDNMKGIEISNPETRDIEDSKIPPKSLPPRVTRKVVRKRFRRILNIVALRPRKVLAQPTTHKQNNVVWLFDNIAYQPVDRSPGDNNATWEAEIVACVFGRERRNTEQYVARIADFVGIDGKFGEDPLIRQRIVQRLQSLLYAAAPSRTLPIDMPLSDGTVQRLNIGPTDRNGVISQTVSIQQSQIAHGNVITSQLAGSNGEVSMKTKFVSPDGWLLISDVDDSIKITLTSDTVGILRSTFVSDPEPIAGMPELYQHIEQELKPTWVYLSASPYNLYKFLLGFLHSFYPSGTLMLRETSWSDLSEFAKSYNTGTQTYKAHQVDKIHRWLPARKVICVGDSTQSDPEVYAEMYRKYKGWIQAIFIRKVTNVPHMNKRNSNERFQAAFAGVSDTVWSVFEQPDQLYESITRLKKGISSEVDVQALVNNE